MRIKYFLVLSTFVAGLAARQDFQKPATPIGSQSATSSPARKFPYPEKLSYRIEWRLVTAGEATVQLSHPSSDDWQVNLNIESAGFVTRLYRVADKYKLVTNNHFCALSSDLDAQEGKRHHTARLVFENSNHKLESDERDLIKNTTIKRTVDIAPCTHDIVGALASLRSLDLQPGKSATFAVTDGKKMVNVRVDAQAKENVSIAGRTYRTVRYEAFLFDNVLYKRKGRLLIWITDDTDRVPVRLRFHLGFPIGTILLELDKQQKL